ncbi:hypothetical protein BOX15_Mlig006794g1 [Macrostomum lignano]|uniref:Uncharacterized protein n=2 Tax=Macrostomum lignano TaxID=282301 RepID=A0A267H6C9_9PLAT|nr:hypothetical protein BOX15_Mlig006794g1 [Macrostomum lignano]
MTLSLTLDWIIEKLELKEENLDNIKSLSLPGRYDEKISVLGSSLVMFSRLKNLDLSRNALCSLSGLDSLAQLESLNLYYNCIDSMSELLKLRKNVRLQQLDLRLNPVSRSEPDYRLYLIQMLPDLKRLDDRSVAETERNSALLHFTTEQAAGLRGLRPGRDSRTPSVIEDDLEEAASEPAPSPRQPQSSPSPPPPPPQSRSQQPAWQPLESPNRQGRDEAYSEWLSEVQAQARWTAADAPTPQPQQRHQQSASQTSATAPRRFHLETYGSQTQASHSASDRAASQQLQQQRRRPGDPPSSESSQPNSDTEAKAAEASAAAEAAAAGERRSSFSTSFNADGGVPRLVLSDSGRSAANQPGADRQRVLKKRLPRARWEKPPAQQQQQQQQLPPPVPAGRGRKEVAADAASAEMAAQQSQQAQPQLQCGECPGLDLSKPCPFLNELASLAEKHWAGPGSLLRSRRFQEAGRSVLMQLAQFIRSESASETAALSSRLAHLEQENTRLLREVGQLAGGGAAARSTLRSHQFDESGYQSGLASQSQVDELTKEIDRLKVKLRSLEQVELISGMLQESHKSLLLTNEHLMSELRLMRRRDDAASTGASAGGSVADLSKSLQGGYGRKAREASEYEDSATPHSSTSSHRLNGGSGIGGGGSGAGGSGVRSYANGRQTSTGGTGGLEGIGKSATGGISALSDWR